MDDFSKNIRRNKGLLGLVGAGVGGVALLLNWSIHPSDELAARFLRYVLDRGSQVHRLDGSVREITKEFVQTISVTDCRNWMDKDDIFVCAMRFSDRTDEEYLAAFEASWQRDSPLSNVDNYRVVQFSIEKQREILIERGMLRK